MIQCAFVEKHFHFESIDSTNDFAKSLMELPERGLFVISADSQSAGRGQRGNSFYSGPGGLFASIICCVSDINRHFIYNRAISLAISDAIAALCPLAPLAIKWPNDIFWSKKKMCGILLESTPQDLRHLIIGFGINVNIPGDAFPKDLKDTATSLAKETGAAYALHDLLWDICNRFQNFCRMDEATAHAIYRSRLYRLGSAISIQSKKGLYKGVLEDGRLCLGIGGAEQRLSSGSITFID